MDLRGGQDTLQQPARYVNYNVKLLHQNNLIIFIDIATFCDFCIYTTAKKYGEF